MISRITHKDKKFCLIQLLVTVIGIFLIFYGAFRENLDIMSLAMLLIWLGNIIFSLEKFRKRFYFFVFQCTFFTFLLGRVVISYVSGHHWWKEIGQAYENNFFAIVAIAVSLISVLIGAFLTEIICDRNGHNIQQKCSVENISKKEFRRNLQAVALVVFSITYFFYVIQEGEKLFYIWSKSYLQFYTGFNQQLPFWVYTIASFMKYSLCLFLGTLPSKRRAFVPLVLYVISNIPSLIIGVRNPIVLSILFTLAYYVLRDGLDNKEKWFGRFEKFTIALCIPIGIVFLAAYASIRSNISLKTLNPFKLFMDFFYGQGVTINVLTQGYGYRMNLPERQLRNYTFGGIIDYIIHGNVGQLLFGTSALPEGNSWTNGRLSNNLSHNLSYTIMQEDYLKGKGLGSSYILETYIDFGYLGIIIFSLVLGGLLIWYMRAVGKNYLLNAVILVSLTEIFFIPRAEATGWLTFIVTLQFWVCIFLCYFGAWLVGKCHWMSLILTKFRIKVKE